MRLLWHSNAPWSSVGYGVQTRVFTPRLKALGHQVAISAFYGLEGGVLDWNGIPVYCRGYHPYGMDIYSSHAAHFEADIVLSLMDAWVWDLTANIHHIPWVPWFPVDSEPLPPPVAEQVKHAFARIAMSRFGARMLAEAGLDCFYIPHGVDTSVFQPGDRKAAREHLGLPADAFVVGMVAANKGSPSRKCFAQNFEAFAEFRKSHRDAILYVHSQKAEHGEAAGVNLMEICKHFELKPGKDVFFCDPYLMVAGLPDPYMVDAYRSMDVLLNVSMGEGFGIPILEAQACGVPVIVGDWTSMPELCFAGWKVGKSESLRFWTPLSTFQFVPKPEAITDRLHRAYDADRQKLGIEARAGALAYDADRITEVYWCPALEQIGAALEDAKAKACKHEFIGVGLFNPDGSLSIPCRLCGAEKRVLGENESVYPGGFANPLGLKFVHPDGLEWLLMREVERDYELSELTRESIVADIGAHVGVVSMTIAKRFGCKVVAFEPEPGNFKRLAENVKANGLGGLIAIRDQAITGDRRDVRMSGDGANSGGFSIYGEGGEASTSITLADVLAGCGGHIDLLKIDCEGAEFEIFSDAVLGKMSGHIGAVRGEIHRARGDSDALLRRLRAVIPDTKMTLQG